MDLHAVARNRRSDRVTQIPGVLGPGRDLIRFTAGEQVTWPTPCCFAAANGPDGTVGALNVYGRRCGNARPDVNHDEPVFGQSDRPLLAERQMLAVVQRGMELAAFV